MADKARLVRRRGAAALAALAVLAGAGAAAAGGIAPPAGEGGPACNQGSLGTTACFAGKLCACIHDRGGVMTGVPGGYRWDCGIERPACDDALNPPVTIEEHRGAPPYYPLAVGVDRSDQSINIKNKNK